MSFFDRLQENFNDIGGAVADWAVKIAIALVVLIIGRWIIGMIKKWAVQLLETDAAKTVFEKAGISNALQPSGRTAPQLVGVILSAVLMVLLWLIVANILEIDPVVDLLERLLAVLPLILVAIVLVIIAAAVGSFVADLVRPYADHRGVAWAINGILSFSNAPLRLASWLGLALFGLAVLLGVLLTVWWLAGVQIAGMRPQDVAGWTSLVCVLLGLGSVQMLLIGLIGAYVARIFEEVKRRPHWVVRRSVGLGAPAGTTEPADP